MRLATFFMVCLFCIDVYGEELGDLVEEWKCKEVADKSGSVVLIAGVYEGREYGLIHVAGTTNLTLFDVDGFYRSWRYGFEDSDKPDYTFIMKPKGLGAFFIYKGLTEEEIAEGKTVPSYVVKCEQNISQNRNQD
jgi:hypothetical protein